jgi:hypothetical protein
MRGPDTHGVSPVGRDCVENSPQQGEHDRRTLNNEHPSIRLEKHRHALQEDPGDDREYAVLHAPILPTEPFNFPRQRSPLVFGEMRRHRRLVPEIPAHSLDDIALASSPAFKLGFPTFRTSLRVITT